MRAAPVKRLDGENSEKQWSKGAFSQIGRVQFLAQASVRQPDAPVRDSLAGASG
jgi:hypothetical protein